MLADIWFALRYARFQQESLDSVQPTAIAHYANDTTDLYLQVVQRLWAGRAEHNPFCCTLTKRITPDSATA